MWRYLHVGLSTEHQVSRVVFGFGRKGFPGDCAVIYSPAEHILQRDSRKQGLGGDSVRAVSELMHRRAGEWGSPGGWG